MSLEYDLIAKTRIHGSIGMLLVDINEKGSVSQMSNDTIIEKIILMIKRIDSIDMERHGEFRYEIYTNHRTTPYQVIHLHEDDELAIKLKGTLEFVKPVVSSGNTRMDPTEFVNTLVNFK